MSYFKNKNIWFWGFMILLLINISVIGSMAYVMYNIHNKENYTAFHHKMMKKKKHPRHNKSTMSLIKQLNLTDKQQQNLKVIRKEHFKRMKQLKANLFKTQHQLFDVAGSDNPDSTLIAEYRTKMMTIQGQIADESLAFLAELKKNLDPEQQELMKEHFREKYKGVNNTHNNN